MDLSPGIQRFQAHAYPRLSERFEGLAGGQSPHTLFITCSDSRIDPSMITQTLPGELFVVRNAGNLVPAPDVDYSTSSAVEYAVDALGVKQIVVCGHSGCGAMGAALNPTSVEALPTSPSGCAWPRWRWSPRSWPSRWTPTPATSWTGFAPTPRLPARWPPVPSVWRPGPTRSPPAPCACSAR